MKVLITREVGEVRETSRIQREEMEAWRGQERNGWSRAKAEAAEERPPGPKLRS